MAGIAVLDELTANQIAAGEVVERPASVVKELVENSLDARATVITVEAWAGGVRQLIVVDNGCGMDEEDARLAFLRYATSKLRCLDDLNRITTLGFRGEALPSIVAVSKVKLKTKTAGIHAGTFLEIHGGQLITCRQTGVAAGTSITVEDLFYNTPARRKHLKKWTTEGGLIGDYICRLAMSRPAVKIGFKHNGREVFSSPGSGQLIDVLAAAYGIAQAGGMLPIGFQNEWLKIEGYVSKPSVNRSSRQQITVIVNNRYIRSPAIALALQDAPHTMLPGGRYPVAVIHLTIDPGLVDVNIHPAKLEIRLLNEKEVSTLVRQSVREALHTSLVIPGLPVQKDPGRLPTVPGEGHRFTKEKEIIRKETVSQRVNQKPIRIEQDFFTFDMEPPGLFFSESLPGYNSKSQPFPPVQIIGHLLPTYILGCGEEGLYLIDQHAAHERVLYEDYLAGMSSGSLAAQMLLTPAPLHLSHGELQSLLEYREFFTSLGFEMDDLSGDTMLLRGVPVNFPFGEAEAYFRDVLDYLAAPGRSPDRQDVIHHLAATAACRAAVKSGSRLSVEAMKMLLEKLTGATNPYTCPHGRPTTIMFSFTELARRFLRT
ncbi:MAG TPA: DNA mismatch repair endonuclease MutL [Desulfotomaculum sp.]|nr:DNA mismatch repair endonuclease MutL [Desulfotomaculum sp.]